MLGWDFPLSMNALDVHFFFINKGDEWLKHQGRSLFYHFREAFSLLWPQDKHNRWSDLILKSFCEHEVTVLLGSADSGKTWTMSKIALVDYWSQPDKTLWLISTTEGRGSELRIWGATKDLFNQAKTRHPNLAGKPLDYLKTITTDSLDDEKELARSLRRGLIIVPCKTGGLSSGLAPFIGIKAPRLRHAGDELAVMTDSFLNAYSNWYGKSDFKGIMSGNFMETDDPLGIASEPEDGWDSFHDTGKTQEWTGKFYNAHVVALDGRDSPNFDLPPNQYDFLIGEKKLNAIKKTYGTDSWQWWSQCVGKPVKGMDIWRVLSKDFAKQHHADEDIIWSGKPLTSLYALDPAYGGGDRCVGRRLDFGEAVDKTIILRVGEPEIIPIARTSNLEPEEQIAIFVKNRLEQLGIPPQNCFYDSFGRGTLGFSFAKLFGATCPVPVDSGSQPTTRPVRFDLYIEELNNRKRLKRCDEHYIKFITELWFSVRETIQAEQLRNLDAETLREGCSRKFTRKNDKLEVEPKDDMKTRLGKSPDLFDNLAIGVEGARRLGFKIQRIGGDIKKSDQPDWLDKQVKGYQELLKDRQLVNA
jgi:hypothetical protein